jgi:hypothetical protein
MMFMLTLIHPWQAEKSPLQRHDVSLLNELFQWLSSQPSLYTQEIQVLLLILPFHLANKLPILKCDATLLIG